MEISIVLVIIGLLVGGILVGQALITAAQIRAQIAQLEKFNQAANTFHTKYGALPGDMGPQTAAAFGFTARTGKPGLGDGNGIVMGYFYQTTLPIAACYLAGEAELFWMDLAQALLIPGNYNNNFMFDGSFTVPGSALSNWLPPAMIGSQTYIAVIGTADTTLVNSAGAQGGTDYYAIESIQSGKADGEGIKTSTAIAVVDAYNMDLKIDDGMPTTGNVLAAYIANATDTLSFVAGANPATTTSCYDSGTLTYATSAAGSRINCSLIIKAQF